MNILKIQGKAYPITLTQRRIHGKLHRLVHLGTLAAICHRGIDQIVDIERCRRSDADIAHILPVVRLRIVRLLVLRLLVHLLDVRATQVLGNDDTACKQDFASQDAQSFRCTAFIHLSPSRNDQRTHHAPDAILTGKAQTIEPLSYTPLTLPTIILL